MEEMSLGQRIVAVVALAAIFLLVGAYLVAPQPFTGWIAYAPLHVSPSRLVVARDGLTGLANLFVWFGLVLGWLAGSLVLLRDPHQHRGETGLSGAGTLEGRIAEREDPTV